MPIFKYSIVFEFVKIKKVVDAFAPIKKKYFKILII